MFWLVIFSSSVQAQQSYSRLIAFGDSLSDTGNIANALGIDFPYPYFENRISDGLVALDYLATEIGSTAEASQHLFGPLQGYNYAIAGGNILGSDLEDLTTQVSAYLSRVNDFADPDALFVVLMGGNDIRDIRSITSQSVAIVQIDLVLDKLIEQLARLNDAGAKTILVSNVANIGRLPETLQREVDDPGISARAAAYSQIYNDRLAQRLENFSSQSGMTILDFDLYTALENILANAEQLGFTQTQVGCFDFDNGDFHPDCLFGLRFDRFVFFDNLHPTNAAHQYVAQAMIESLNIPTSERVVPMAAIILLLSE